MKAGNTKTKKAWTKAKKIVVIKDKKDLIKNHWKHEKDTWSTSVQVAILSNRITHITEHLKLHKKDKDSRLWLIKLTGQRRKLLNYISKKKPEEYSEIISTLWLKK